VFIAQLVEGIVTDPRVLRELEPSNEVRADDGRGDAASAQL